MWPLITSALAALLWLLQVTLGTESEHLAWQGLDSWLRVLALGLSALALGLVLQRLLAQVLRGKHRFRLGSGSELLQSVLSIVLYGVLGLVFFGWGLGQDLGRVLATSALLSAIVGLALQPTLGHLFAGVSIEIERRFKVGDHVRRDDLEGQIVSLSWRSVTLRTDRGSVIVMPNSEFTSRTVELIPAEQPFRHLVPLHVSSEWPPGQVMRVVMQVLGSELPGLCSQPAPSVVLLSNDPYSGSLRYGVRFYTTRFLDRSTLASAVLERLWYAMSREGMAWQAPATAWWALPEAAEGLAGGPRAPSATGAAEAAGAALAPALRRPVRPAVAGAGARPGLAADEVLRIGGLQSLSPPAREALLGLARWQHYGRDERCDGSDFKLLLQGRLRELRPWHEEGAAAAAEAELAALLQALAEPPEAVERETGTSRLEGAVLRELSQQGALVLGPLAQRLCARLARLTEDPWLAWQALARSVDEPAAREALLRHAPAERARTLEPGTWLVAAPVLGLPADTRQCLASQGSSLLVWEPARLHARLQQLPQADQWALGELLAWRGVGTDGLSARLWSQWLAQPWAGNRA